MNNNLEKISILEKEKLSGAFYFQSLLEQAHSKGILMDSEIERLQCECLDFLAYKVERFNAGDSSSIRMEKAQSIMDSNLFTIGLWLKTYKNPDDAVTAIQNEPIADLYQKGRKRIDTMLFSTKVVHAKMLHALVVTKNIFYRPTIEDGIKGFFKLYYPDFAAQEIHITADYPTCNAIPQLAGIEFIQAYLNALYYENQFCFHFDPDDIHHLLCGYEKAYHELLINIYKPVLTAAIGCILTGADTHRLVIPEDGAAHLSRLFSKMTKNEILIAIQKAACELKRVFMVSDGLEQYMQRSLPLIADEIEIAVREQWLGRVFCAPAYPENNPKLYFSFGDKMDDEQYRKVISEITQCDVTQNKIAIIKEQVHSLADLEDVLLDAYLSYEEINAVLRGLGLPELAALSKKHLLTSNIEAFELREQEQLLRKCLHDFISALPPKQRELIAKASEGIEEA